MLMVSVRAGSLVMRLSSVAAAGVAVVCSLWIQTASAAPTAEHSTELQAVTTLLTKAGTLYKEGKFKEAGETVKEVQSKIEKLAEGADQQLIGQLQPLH